MPKKRRRSSLGRQLSKVNKKKINRSQEKGDNKNSSDSLKCDDCGEAFSSSYDLKIHHEVHIGDSYFICDIPCFKKQD